MSVGMAIKGIRRLGVVLALGMFCTGGCGAKGDNGQTAPDCSERPVILIPLAGPLLQDNVEVSGLAWYRDHLVVLPQYPRGFREGEHGALFALRRVDIEGFLDGSGDRPLEPIRIDLDDSGLDSAIEGLEYFMGYQAVAFVGDLALFTAEAWTADGLGGYLFSGKIDPQLAGLTVETETVVRIQPRSGVAKMSEEALIVVDQTVVTIHEANGLAVNPSPLAHTYDTALEDRGTIGFPNVEYRITDACAPDADGRFWVMNYFWPGESLLKPESDPLIERFGRGPTHMENEQVERLVELRYGASGITLSESAPVQLELIDEPRNWEGLVRLGQRGFLIMTDDYPETMLGFVPGE